MSASVSVDTGMFGTWSDFDTDDATWTFSTPGAGVTITWKDGPAKVNATTYAKTAPLLSEMKFFTAGTPPAGPAAKTFTGFTRTVGNGGSSVSMSGSGSSTFVPGTFINSWTASWTVSATGTLRMQPARGYYEAKVEADDPMPLTNADFDSMHLSGNRFSLYLPVTLPSLSTAQGGKAGLKVSYRTKNGAATLLDLTTSANETTAKGDAPKFLKIYRQRSHFENPMALGERPWKLAEIRDSISSLTRGGALSVPFGFGFLLRGLPRPTEAIAAGGVVAELHVDSSVSISDGVKPKRRPKEKKQESKKKRGRG